MEKKPALEATLVEEFVGNAHGNLERVQEMLAQEPGLVNATWDWGGGDFETALGAASHMGRRDIALFLLDHGARLDIFAAAMLGNVEIIPLIKHAEMGGEEAKAVLEYLQSLH